MTQNKDRKEKIRVQMAATGEPYTEAAHHVGEAASPSPGTRATFDGSDRGVPRGLSRAAESMEAAAAELRRQEWFDLEDDAEPEAIAAWNGALDGLKSASSTFAWVADGWI